VHEDVTLARKRYESRAGDAGRQLTSGFERDHLVVPRMQDQRRTRTWASRSRTSISPAVAMNWRALRRADLQQKGVEGVGLRLVALGMNCVVKICDRPDFRRAIPSASRSPWPATAAAFPRPPSCSRRHIAIEDEMGHAFRVSHGIGDGKRAALGEGDQGKATRPIASTTDSRSLTQASKENSSTSSRTVRCRAHRSG